MIFQNLGLLAVLPLLLSAVTASPLERRGPDDDLAKIATENAYKVLAGTLNDGSDHKACTKENLVIRKE